ncbi:MAG: peptide ABC transporter substrate-binding protein [Chloroflexi bacterium]|nr:peptide ABC transporter substrate-binding protein [Chloroflexota bacterium]
MRVNMRFFVLLLTLAALMVSLGAVAAQEGKILYTGRQMGPSDIPTLDPSQASDVPSVQIIVEIFPELIRLNEETVITEPGLATWTVSDDGLVYTFNIQPEVPWVKYNADSGAVEQVMVDGAPRYVQAQDFAYTMVRTLDPNVASDYGYVLAPWVVGGSELNGLDSEGETYEADRQAAIDALGINVVDEYTLEVTVTKASAAIESVFAMWITTATPGWLIDELGDVWIEPENIVSYGPFAVKSWNHGADLTLIKNPFFAGVGAIPAANLDEVVFQILDTAPQFDAFQAGTLQVSEVDGTVIPRILADPDLASRYNVAPGTCTYYYGVNQTREPFNDPRVVRALSASIDRQAIIDAVTQAGELPAYMFVLPSMTAAPKQEDYPDQLVTYDPDYAKAQLQEYLDEKGITAADITGTLLHNTSALHASIAQVAQQMWSETLGVNIQISAQEFGVYLDQRRDADVYRAGWCFDYPDSNNWYFDVFHSSVDPDNHFSNAEYDALVEAAGVAETVEERTALYAQADAILTNTAASIIPIYYYVTDDITADGVERTNSVIGREYYEKWDLAG